MTLSGQLVVGYLLTLLALYSPLAAAAAYRPIIGSFDTDDRRRIALRLFAYVSPFLVVVVGIGELLPEIVGVSTNALGAAGRLALLYAEVPIMGGVEQIPPGEMTVDTWSGAWHARNVSTPEGASEASEVGRRPSDVGAASGGGWRRRVGIMLFVLHLVLPILALILVPILGLSSGTNTLLIGLSFVGGPDVLLIAAIAVLGKDGVTELMAKLGSVIRRITRWDAVTAPRYRVGTWVMVISLLLPTVILFFWHDSVKEINGQPGWAFWVLLASTFAFIGAVMSMGAPFWLRVQAIFTWDAEILIPAPDPDDD